jgi:hypothetical protein
MGTMKVTLASKYLPNVEQFLEAPRMQCAHRLASGMSRCHLVTVGDKP